MPYITTAERIGRRKGLREGVQQGLQQGLQQGMLEDAREMLLEALEERFGGVPLELAEKVQSISDRKLLKTLLRRAIRCGDLDAFEGELKQVLES